MIHRFKTIDSTNTYAKALADRGAPHGTVVVAEEQSAGRGRLGRSFHSPAGAGLYLSMILRPNCLATELMHLTCAAAVAACDAVEAVTGLRPGIKWTNDLVFENRKLGGILTELGFDGEKAAYAVIGIGINCNHSLEDFPSELQDVATSLSIILERAVSLAELEKSLIEALNEISQELISGKHAILERYRANCITLGREISIVQGDSLRHARAEDIDSDGGLIVRFDDGHQETVAFGEVSIRGMYGYL